MIGYARLGLMLAAVVCVAVGCNSGAGSNPSPGGGPHELQQQANPPVLDLPLPMGFKYDESKATARQEPGMRIINHVYQGSDDKYSVARFYRKQMPVMGWNIRFESLDKGVLTLEFEKEAETCRIELKDSGWFGGTEIVARVYPNAAPRK